MKKLLCLLLAVSPIFNQTAAAQNTRLVRDLIGGPEGGFDYDDTRLLTNLDSLCIFLAAGKGGSRLICTSNGTYNGTFSLLPPIGSNETFGEWTVASGRIWFIVKRFDKSELYSSDGTFAGTQLRYSVANARLDMIRSFQNDVIFRESPDDFSGDKLQRFGAGATTPSTIGTFYWFVGLRDVCVSGDKIWAIGETSDNTGRYLIKSDGSPGSLQKIANLGAGSDFNQAIFMTAAGDKVFFFWKTETSPYQLWVSDGTATGTLPLKTFDEPFFNDLRQNRAVAALNGKFIFQAELVDDPKGREIWISDGTAAGTVLLKDCVTDGDDGNPKNFTIWKGKLWFSAINDLWNPRVWSSDGTTAGTKEALTNFLSNEYAGIDLTVFNDSLAFSGYAYATGGEVFLSMGTPATTKAVSDQSPAEDDSFAPGNLVAAKKKLFFTARKPSQGRELWIYDPSEKPFVSTQTIENVSFAKVSPNPGSDFFIIETERTGVLEIFSPAGSLLKRMPLEAGKTEVQADGWPSGVFSGRVVFGAGVRVFKWLKI